jgi:hypothetical protein
VAETYTSLTDKQAGTLVRARAELVGIPHKLSGISSDGSDGEGTAGSYSVSPISIVFGGAFDGGGYAANETAGFVYTGKSLSVRGEGIDPISNETTFGTISFSLHDFKIASGFTGWGSAGDYLFVSVFAARKASRQASLSADLTATATSVNVGADSLTAGQAYFLASETIISQQTSSTPNVTRGIYDPGTPTDHRDRAAGSRARKHTAHSDTTPYPDNLYDRPRIWFNREVRLYFTFDHADIDKSEELGPFRYRISAYPSYSDGMWTIRADSYLNILKKEVARDAYAGKVTTPLLRGGQTLRAWAEPIGEAVRVQPGWRATNDRVWFDIDGEAIEADLLETGTTATRFSFILGGRGRLGTRRTSLDEGDTGTEIREIIPTDTGVNTPRIGHVAKGAGYSLANLTASDHPVVAFLCMLLSSGWENSTSAWDGGTPNVDTDGDNTYDVLPGPWGIGFPADRVDLSAFEDFITETREVTSFPRFRLGHDGPFSLLDWWYDEVAPFLGVALHLDISGKLTLSRLADAFALSSSAVTVNLAHIERGYHDYAINARGVTGKVAVKYTGSDGTKVSMTALSVFGLELFPDEHRVMKFSSEGATERTRDVIADRATAIIEREERPRPVVTFVLPWTHHAGTSAITPGTLLSVTDAGMPDIVNGDYGVSAEEWIATSVTYAFDPSRPSASVRVEAHRIEKGRHFGPAATVSSWAAGTNTATVNANDYTPTAGLGSFVPTSDVRAFGSDGSQGGAGYMVAYYDSDGVKKTDPIEISTLSYASNTIQHGGAPSAVPQAGWIIRLAPYSDTVDTDHTAGDIHDDQDAYGYMTDSASHLGTSIDGPEWSP